MKQPHNAVQANPTPDNPAFAEVTQLAQWLREKKTTPTKLTRYFLDRLGKLGPKFNAVVTLTADRAMQEANKAEQELAAGKDRGPLHGIPYAVKDLIAAKGHPTSWGSGPLKDQRFDDDATVVAKLKQAGAVLVAKLAMVELAGGMGYRQANASFTGPGLNPWNVGHWAGGSSSGSGSAVAAGLVPFAIGSETWGSILTPAGFCGITGLRPTYGRVSRHGAMALSWTMDKLGLLARSAQDSAVVLSVIAGPDPLDSTTLPQKFAGVDSPLKRRYRIAILKDGDVKLAKGVAENYKQSLELLRAMADLTEVELPDLPFDQAADVVLSAELASALEDIIGTDKALQLTAPEDRIGGIADSFIFAKDYIRGLRIRGKAIAALDQWLRPFDALLAPALATEAYSLSKPFNESNAGYSAPPIGGAGNLVGLPAVFIPNGFGEQGLPTGIQFVGRALTEGTILRIAHDVQQRTNWHRTVPKL